MNEIVRSMPESLAHRRAVIAEIMRRGQITDADVALLRRDILGDDPIDGDLVDALFDLERSANLKCPHWTAFFVEAITDHIVWHSRPTGVVNESQGEWLINQADAAMTLPAFAALINVMAEADRIPLWFAAAVRARAIRGWPGAEIAIAAAAAEAA